MSISVYQQTQLLCLAIALCGFEVSLTSCKPAGLSTSPEALCAAPETVNGLASIVVSGTTLPASEVHLVLDSPVLDSFDKTTKRTSCTATIHPTFTGALGKADQSVVSGLLGGGVLNGIRIKSPKEVLAARQSYVIQPAADGKGYVYTLGEDVVSALQAWATATQSSASDQETRSGDLPAAAVTSPTASDTENADAESSNDEEATAKATPNESDLNNDVQQLRTSCPTIDDDLYSWKVDYEQRKELANEVSGDYDELKSARPDQATAFTACDTSARKMLRGDQ